MHPAVESEHDAAASFRYWCKDIAAGSLETDSCNWLYRIELWGCSVGCMNYNSERKRETQNPMRKRAVGGEFVVALLCAEFLKKNLSISKPKSKIT